MNPDVPKSDRRAFLLGAAALASLPAAAHAAPKAPLPDGFDRTSLRGAISAVDFGVEPGALDDQSKAFARMIAKAAEGDAPVFLPPGTYTVSNITLPPRLRLHGVPGATRLLYGGNGHLLLADRAEHIELTGLVLDGANRWLADYAKAVACFRNVGHLVVDNCRITGSGGYGLALEAVSGRVERSSITGAAEAGIWSVQAGRLSIAGNTVADCANGGILVHRWQPSEDFTVVSGNRVERIAARRGGTGPYGNGINAFRADKVVISANTVADCAFSAIRANSSSDVQIAGNTCVRSGETGIYAEFAFEGAVIQGNVVDGAANGISIVNFDKGGRLALCNGNMVRNLTRDGPYPADAPGFGVGITVEADTAVTGNVVEAAPLYGMKLGWGPYLRNVSATGNVLRDCATGIAVSVVEGTGSTVVSGNVIDGSPRGAVVGYRWADPATGDLALATGSGFPNLTVERNQVS